MEISTKILSLVLCQRHKPKPRISFKEHSVKLDESDAPSPVNLNSERLDISSKDKFSVFKRRFTVKKGRRSKRARKSYKKVLDETDETMRKLQTSKDPFSVPRRTQNQPALAPIQHEVIEEGKLYRLDGYSG